MTAMETMRERFATTAGRLLDENPRLAVVLAAISTDAFAEAAGRHPERVVNVGIREPLMVSAAGGLALAGMRPIAHSYAPFLVERSFEQIKLDIGHQGVGAVLVSIGASYDWTEGGRTHQCPGDVALLDTLEGWHVHVPGHPDEAEALLRAAVAGDGRHYVRLSTQANRAAQAMADGRFRVMRRGGRGTVIAVGPLLDRTMEATDDLDLTVLYATTIRPFDAPTLVETLSRPAVVLVEPYLTGTSSAAVSAALAHLHHRLLALGVPHAELRRYGDPADHDAAHGLDAPGLRRRILAFLEAEPLE